MPYSKSHKQVARQRILDKAYGLFISGGYDATTIKQIMAASNLTHGAFYGHFASKKDLFRQAVLKNSTLFCVTNSKYQHKLKILSC